MAIDNTPLVSLIGPSGLDTGAIIDALASVRRNPILRLEAQRAKLQKQSSEFGTLRSRLDALRTKAAQFDTSAELRAFAAVSSNTTALTAASSSAAAEGTFNITVNALATAESRIATGAAERTGLAIGSGTISITSGGTQYDIAIAADSDLDAIRDAINASGVPVTATIIDDGDATAPYRLVLTSDSTGAANSFTVDVTNFTPQVPTFSFSTLASGQDASITVNGLAVTRSSNTLTDVVDGVTLNLLKTGESSTVTVTKDREAVKSRLKELVAAFNDVIDLFKAHSSADLKETTAVLYGDVTLRSAQNAIRGVINKQVSGTGSAYDTLASIGITTGPDGRLTTDDAKLTSALNADFDGVIAVFTTPSDGIAAEAQSVALGIQSNSIKSRTDGIQARIRGINRQVDRLEEGLSRYIASLQRKYADLDTIVGRLQTQAGALSALSL